jgi:hypothetical protein
MKTKRDNNRKVLEKCILDLSIPEVLGSTATPDQITSMEEAKLSILMIVDVYYQYSLQEILRTVRQV